MKLDDINGRISVIKALKEVLNLIHKSINEQFKELNITGPQGMVIGILIRHGKMKISDLSSELGLSNSTVSGIIDRLEKQGIVERTRSEDDRRVVYVKVADEFKAKGMKRFCAIEERINHIMSKASSQQIEVILKGINELKKLLLDDER